MVGWGGCQAWTSPSIPYLTGNNSPYPVTEEQGAWIVSIFYIGDLFGAFLNPFFIDRIGRKNTLILFAFPGLIGWGMIIFAKNYIYLYAARIIMGIGQGSTYNSLVIYLAEISEKKVRGILINMIPASNFIGLFVCTSVAAFKSYEFLNYFTASLLIFFIMTYPLLIETPYYHLLCGRHDDAMKSLMKLRGIDDPKLLDLEIREMTLTINDRKLKSSWRELFIKKHNQRGLIIMFWIKITQMMTGIGPISANAQEIFSYSDLSNINAGVQVMIFNGISLFASLTTNAVIERFKRRTLFLTTALISSFCLGTVGTVFFMILYQKTNDISIIKWFPLISLVIFQVAHVVGIGTVPYIIQGEIFPVNVKGAAVSCGMTMGSILIFITSAGYKFLSIAAGVYTTFWIFAISCFFLSIFTFSIMPETKGMTLEDILALRDPEMKIKLDNERNKFQNGCEN
ncbi:facilitated trehalose transporter Tret1-like [Leptopilina boulardi]|uniref:facilitated trehalose transporter Tret1-like n=1 Tax=Leptopilina boulardi TaxID=63433 RepID=UPI0021F59554|nr:facilitated trehalose transporter Tret1-like [Leptopilina boulardi]